MTREEFENKVKDLCYAAGIKFKAPNSDDWKIIEYVCMYHPRISYMDYGEDHIAYLYAHFGMGNIRDMGGDINA